jgi:NAD(P)-dependent dehydrogenase (short-subunit alcohol dehydrogenase family)
MSTATGFDLQGRTAVVTGGSSGIGLATARVLLGAGARVAICGRDAVRLETARAALAKGEWATRVLAHRCDVLDADEIAAFAAAVQTRFGATDILVNNAGQGRVSTFADTSDEAWREELDLKFFSVIRPTRA